VKTSRTKCALCAATLFAIAFAGPGVARMRAAPTISAPQAEASPSPEMAKLIKLYRGTWDYTESYAKTTEMPNGGENTGVYSSELGPGSMSILNRFHSKGPAGDYEGFMIMTWDAKEKAYKEYLVGNGIPGAVISTGQFEGDTLIFRTTFTMGDKSYLIRNETHLDAKGLLISDEFIGTPAPGEKQTPSVHVVATRRP
jgi:hypothetical protein